MKTKIIVLVGIAFCTMLLISPALVSGVDTLEIYGNANEDDTIDMRDLTYVKLIFFGKKPETELADAKYDGKINPLDFIQIKLIIVGKEKELTIVDSADRIVTVKKPVKRLVSSNRFIIETFQTIKVPKDIIVGVSSMVTNPEYEPDILYSEFLDVPTVGYVWSPDVEAILNLYPDVVLIPSYQAWCASTLDNAQNVLESAGITVLRLSCGAGYPTVPLYLEEITKLGYIFDKEEEAEEFLDWYEGILNPIKEKVDVIPEEDKPKVYLEASPSKTYTTLAGGDRHRRYVEAAGGNNIFEVSGAVDPEAVVARDPDIIVKEAPMSASGFRLDPSDTSEMEKVREEIMSRPELQNVKAVKTGKVYVISTRITWGPGTRSSRNFLLALHFTKWFHPDLFKDSDPKAIHQEYLTRFQGLDIDLDKKGVFVYPPLES